MFTLGAAKEGQMTEWKDSGFKDSKTTIFSTLPTLIIPLEV